MLLRVPGCPWAGSAWVCASQQLISCAGNDVICAPQAVPHTSGCTLQLWQCHDGTLTCSCLQEHDQQLVDALYTAHGHLGFPRDFFVKVRHSCC
jgi:hypothetical protein